MYLRKLKSGSWCRGRMPEKLIEAASHWRDQIAQPALFSLHSTKNWSPQWKPASFRHQTKGI